MVTIVTTFLNRPHRSWPRAKAHSLPHFCFCFSLCVRLAGMNSISKADHRHRANKKQTGLCLQKEITGDGDIFPEKQRGVSMCKREGGLQMCMHMWVCVCVCMRLGIQSKSIEGNFTAAHFQAVSPPAAKPHTKAPAATNFLCLSLPAITIYLDVCSVCVCVPVIQSHSSPLTCRLSGRQWHHIQSSQFLLSML